VARRAEENDRYKRSFSSREAPKEKCQRRWLEQIAASIQDVEKNGGQHEGEEGKKEVVPDLLKKKKKDKCLHGREFEYPELRKPSSVMELTRLTRRIVFLNLTTGKIQGLLSEGLHES